MHFHSDDYINFLQRITPETMNEAGKLLQRCTRDGARQGDSFS